MLRVPELIHDGLDWRSAVTADDVRRVRSLVASTGFFNAAEVEVAAGLVTDRLTNGLRSGYHFGIGRTRRQSRGLRLLRPIHGTRDSLELFWIAIAPEEQRRGLGAHVYARAEAAMAEAGAIRIYAETSSSERYAGTSDFYQRMGFLKAGTVLVTTDLAAAPATRSDKSMVDGRPGKVGCFKRPPQQ
jgi:ribosomal protein S18 acetylase RimI-like enzyme